MLGQSGPKAGARKQKRELSYTAPGRFFTVTGWHIEGTPAIVEKRTPELAQLHRATFPAQKETKQNRGSEPANLRERRPD